MSNVEIISNNVIEVSIEPSPVVDIEVFNGGVIVGTNLSLQYQLILGRLASQPQLYREFTYINDSLTGIDAWATSNKIIKIFEIRFTYTGSNLTQKTLRDIQSNRILTVNYTYTDGNLTSINEVFS
jgi:hypothetical protein